MFHAYSFAKSNEVRMGKQPMPSIQPKGINSARAHTQSVQLCQKYCILHGDTRNAFSFAKSNTFRTGKRPMHAVVPKVTNSAWTHIPCLPFCQKQYIPHGHTPNACISSAWARHCGWSARGRGGSPVHWACATSVAGVAVGVVVCVMGRLRGTRLGTCVGVGRGVNGVAGVGVGGPVWVVTAARPCHVRAMLTDCSFVPQCGPRCGVLPMSLRFFD